MKTSSDKVDEIIDNYLNPQRQGLLPLLQEIQNELGYLPEESINRIGQALDLPVSKIYGVATFYDLFKFERRGKFHFRMCHGTTCHIEKSHLILQEAERLLKIKSGQSTRDGMFSIEVVNCMGACGLSPVINVNGIYFNGVDSLKLREIIEHCKINGKPA